MTKKDTLSLLIILCLTSLLLSAAYFLTPHAVVRFHHTDAQLIRSHGFSQRFRNVLLLGPHDRGGPGNRPKNCGVSFLCPGTLYLPENPLRWVPRRLGCDDPYALHARRKYPRHRFGPSRIPVLPRQRCFRELFLSIFSPSLFPQCSDLYPNPPGRNSSLC